MYRTVRTDGPKHPSFPALFRSRNDRCGFGQTELRLFHGRKFERAYLFSVFKPKHRTGIFSRFGVQQKVGCPFDRDRETRNETHIRYGRSDRMQLTGEHGIF